MPGFVTLQNLCEQLWVTVFQIKPEKGSNILAILPQENKTETSNKGSLEFIQTSCFILVSPKWYSEHFQEIK